VITPPSPNNGLILYPPRMARTTNIVKFRLVGRVVDLSGC
jgi:hypothetical protein